MSICQVHLPAERVAILRDQILLSCDPAAEFELSLRRWAAIAAHAPLGGAVQRHVLGRLRELIVAGPSLEAADCGPRLAQLMHRDMSDLRLRPGVEAAARHPELARRIAVLLQVLEQTTRAKGPAVLRQQALAAALESACWALVDRLGLQSPRLGCVALIELVNHLPEADAAPQGMPSERVRSLCEQAQAQLAERLLEQVQREAWSCGTLVLRLIHDSGGAVRPRRQIGVVLDIVFPLLARQDPGLAAWLVEAGERALHRAEVGAVWSA